MQLNITTRAIALVDRLVFAEQRASTARVTELLNMKKPITELEEDFKALDLGLEVECLLVSPHLRGSIAMLGIEAASKEEQSKIYESLRTRGFQDVQSWKDDEYILARECTRITISIKRSSTRHI